MENFFKTGCPVDLDLYLVHEDDVAFSFSKGTQPKTTVQTVKPAGAPAKRPEFGYGREGIQTAIGNTPVEIRKDVFTAEFRPLGEVTTPTAGKDSYKEFQFPIINGVSALTPNETDQITGFPLVLVQYVEIQGNPTNIQSNL